MKTKLGSIISKLLLFTLAVLLVLPFGFIVHAEENTEEEAVMRTITVPSGIYARPSYNLISGDRVSVDEGAIPSVDISGVTGHVNIFTFYAQQYVDTVQNGDHYGDRFKDLLVEYIASDEAFTGSAYDNIHGFYYKRLFYKAFGAGITRGEFSFTAPNSTTIDWTMSDAVFLEELATRVDFTKDDFGIRFDENELYLTGFSADNTISASWTGVHTPDGYTIDDVDVFITCGYTVILNSDENERQEFDHPGNVTVRAANLRYSRPLSDYYANNPYDGRCMLFIQFTPYILGKAGKATEISFDFDKNMDITVPGGALEEASSADCYFLNPTTQDEFHNWGDSFIYFKWTGVSVEDTVEYLSSNIEIELYCHGDTFETRDNWQWVAYSPDIYSFRSMRINFNLTDIETYVEGLGSHLRFQENNSTNYSGAAIRITPCYNTGTQYVRGKPITIYLSTLGGTKSLIEDNLDGTETDLNEPVYDPISGIIDDILPGGDVSGNGVSLDVSDLGGITLKFFSMLKTLFSACGQFPGMVASVFVFLPSYYTYMLTIGLAVVIILRILGR